jgi:hypothetical protein
MALVDSHQFLLNTHETLLVLLGILGFKLVAYVKCNRASHERRIYFFCLMFFLFSFSFVLLRNKQYVSLGVY